MEPNQIALDEIDSRIAERKQWGFGENLEHLNFQRRLILNGRGRRPLAKAEGK